MIWYGQSYAVLTRREGSVNHRCFSEAGEKKKDLKKALFQVLSLSLIFHAKCCMIEVAVSEIKS